MPRDLRYSAAAVEFRTVSRRLFGCARYDKALWEAYSGWRAPRLHQGQHLHSCRQPSRPSMPRQGGSEHAARRVTQPRASWWVQNATPTATSFLSLKSPPRGLWSLGPLALSCPEATPATDCGSAAPAPRRHRSSISGWSPPPSINGRGGTHPGGNPILPHCKCSSRPHEPGPLPWPHAVHRSPCM